MTWTVLKAAAPEVIWARYADALGLDVLKGIFGNNWPPAAARVNEHVYCWRDMDENPRPFDPKDHPAAWLSLSTDNLDPTTAHMSRGVWPEYHGKGLGKIMRNWAEDWCREHGITMLVISVYAKNGEHFANVLEDPYWLMEGVSFYPPTFTFSHEVTIASGDQFHDADKDHG